MGTLNRFYGAFLGMAVGDALGAQALGVEHPEEVPLVNSPPMAWTDATQHLVLTSEALVEVLAFADDRRALGRAVANALVRWYHDPTTSSRHPGRSSLRAVVHLLEGQDWETSGNPDSDGADPLLRAVAVGLAWPPDDVVAPAITATSVTHRHPTALQAAVVTAWLTSALARGARLDIPLIVEACQVGMVAVPQGAAVQSVSAALDVARRDLGAPIDPRSIPGGDAGTRSGSALGLALLIALRFDGHPHWARLERAVATAARMPGAPEVVAALAGAFLGVAWGLGGLPRHFVENTEGAAALLDLARALHLRARGLDPAYEHAGEDVGSGWEGRPAVRSYPPHGDESATDIEWVTFDETTR